MNAQLAASLIARFSIRWGLNDICLNELSELIQSIIALYEEDVHNDVHSALEDAAMELAIRVSKQ